MATDENACDTKRCELDSSTEEKVSQDTADDSAGPDTSSFTAFLASFFSSSDPKNDDEESKILEIEAEAESEPVFNYDHEPGRQAAGFSRDQDSTEKESGLKVIIPDTSLEDEGMPVVDLPEMSDPSKLLSDRTRGFLYNSLPSQARGRKWVLIYSTWMHGISLSTLYRRSARYSGLSMLVVGDNKGAVFGGLVESPLTSQSRKYQGTNSTFLFTDVPGRPVIYHPTGVNRYFTLCSPRHIALGGGRNRFALYLDEDLLHGSSYASETYGNPCLASSQEFVVKEVELWAFVPASEYEKILALYREYTPGISALMGL